MRNAIEKSLTRKVMNFWKWESLWGNFTTVKLPFTPELAIHADIAQNWDPIMKDNIMVTGYMVLACGLYQSCTGDDRYTKDGSLVYQVTNRRKYQHSIHTMNKALHENWKNSKHLLYPCEVRFLGTGLDLPALLISTQSQIGSTVCAIWKALLVQ